MSFMWMVILPVRDQASSLGDSSTVTATRLKVPPSSPLPSATHHLIVRNGIPRQNDASFSAQNNLPRLWELPVTLSTVGSHCCLWAFRSGLSFLTHLFNSHAHVLTLHK